MKIIHAIFSFNVGGSETMLVDIINRQCKEAAISLIIVNNKVNSDLLNTIDKRVNVCLLNRKESNKIQLLSAFLKINRFVHRFNPDIIHCHDNKLFPFFIRWKIKTCLTVHSINLSIAFINKYNRIFAISAAVKKNIKELCGINAQVIYNGIEIEHYRSRTDYSFNKRTDEFKIVQVSRLNPKQKGQHIAIKAIKLLNEQNPDLNVKLYLIGGGEGLAELEKIADEYNVKNQIVFTGFVDRDRIKNNLQNYHLLIQPSLVEGFGLTIIEGFACGLPVIVSDSDGPKEIVEVLHSGLSVKPNDSEDLAEKIYQVFLAYISNTLKDSNYILKDKNLLKIFDIETTVKMYMENYIANE